MRTIVAILIAAFIFAGTSCKKYLAAYSQNQLFLQTVDDLDELLVGDGYIHAPSLLQPVVMDDDIEYSPGDDSRSLIFDHFGFHFWQRLPYLKGDGSENSEYAAYYSNFYKTIASLNTVLFNAADMKSKNNTDSRLQRISGEAHFLRAYYYLLLVNIYGKPYNPSTAATDFGVPLKITPEILLTPFPRASVQNVYNQIEADLLEAENELKGFNETSVYRANQAVVQALLSRMYLYREEYEKAVAYANKVIERTYKIRDLNTWESGTLFLTRTSTELIFTLPTSGNVIATLMYNLLQRNGINNYRISEDLLGIFSNKDLRLKAFFIQSEQGDYLARKTGDEDDADVGATDFNTFRLPEMYLNKAEALAVTGRNSEAIATLQELRRKRFKPEDLPPVDVSGSQLVNLIRDERRRELCFEAQRWFDLRRYGVNSKYPWGRSIRHRSVAWDASGVRYTQGYYELKPYAEEPAAYILSIPQKEIDQGQGVIANEERPARPLLQ